MASYNKKISNQSPVRFNDINRELEDSENTDLEERVEDIEERVEDIEEVIGTESSGIIGNFNRLSSQLNGTLRINIMDNNIDVEESSQELVIDDRGRITFLPDTIARWNINDNISGEVFVAVYINPLVFLDVDHIEITAFNYGGGDEVELTYNEETDLYSATIPALENPDDANTIVLVIHADSDLNTTDYTNRVIVDVFGALTSSLPNNFEINSDNFNLYKYFDSLSVLYNNFSNLIKKKNYTNVSFNSSGNVLLEDIGYTNIIPIYFDINDTGVIPSFYNVSNDYSIGLHCDVNTGGIYTGSNKTGTLYFIAL